MVDFRNLLEDRRRNRKPQDEKNPDMARTDIEREEQGADEGGMSLTAFLGHRTSGGSGEYLEPWRDKGSVRIWLHTTAAFHALWNHNWPIVKTIKDKQTKEDRLMVFSSRFVCHDPETVTRKARFKDDDGRREHAPVRCPMCLMLDWISAEIAAGRLDWCEPLFKFDGDDPEKCVTLFAGGMVGLFGKKDLSKDEKQEMRKAGVVVRDAWRQKAEVRCQYLFQVVDDADPSAGVVKALEAGDLGDKLKTELNKEIKKRGDKGNPGINPYPLLWEYDENEPQFGKKYAVTALSDDRPTKTILNLIRGPKLDLSKDIAPGNCIELRAAMETHAVYELPFDKFFEIVEREGLMDEAAQAKRNAKPTSKPQTKPAARPAAKDEDDEEEDEDDEPESEPPPKKVQTKPAATAQKKQTAPPPEDEEEGGPCDFCGEHLSDDDLTCPHCGATFDDDGHHVKLDGIPCLDCKTVVPLKDGEDTGTGAAHICPKCATIHVLAPSIEKFYENDGRAGGVKLTWTVEKRHPKVEEPKPAATRGRRGGRGVTSAPKDEPATDHGLGGDELPF
jgi:hypothetical protein